MFGGKMASTRLTILLMVLALFGQASWQVQAQNAKKSKSASVGSIMGVAITEEEANRAAAQQMQRLELQHLQAEANYARARHQALAEGLERVIEDKVLDAEASSRGITTQALLEKELAGKIKEPTMEDLKAHYPPDQVPAPETRDKIFARMQSYLRTENYNKAKAEYVAQLKKKYKVTETLKPLRLSVDTDGCPTLGPDTAPVTESRSKRGADHDSKDIQSCWSVHHEYAHSCIPCSADREGS